MNNLLINDLKKIPRAMVGFLIMAFGTYLIKTMNVGMSPWDTLFLGVEGVTQVSFGVITQVFGLIIIGVSMLLKVYPGIGTVLNMFFFGYFLDLYTCNLSFQVSASIGIRLIFIILGQVILFYGIFIYLSCHFGAGPRDGLFIVLSKISNRSLGTTKVTIEIVVFFIGWMLGGRIGWGTIVTTLLGGVLFDRVLKTVKYNPKEHKHNAIHDYLS